MELTVDEFEILVAIEKNEKELSIEEISEIANVPINIVEQEILELKQKKYIDSNFKITNLGLETLKPYRVKRAIFLAAGFGSRMLPITEKTPKPLVEVNGRRIIETLLEATVKAEIPEIIIITGHLGNQFNYLLDKYPNVKIIENKEYKNCNNIYSVLCVKDMLENSYILESDLLLNNENLIRKYEYRSNVLGQYVKETDDWCYKLLDGKVGNYKSGGKDCYKLYGIYYFDSANGKQLGHDVYEAYKTPQMRDKLFEQIPLDLCNENYKIVNRKCTDKDIVEIDTFDELKSIDPKYQNYK